MPELDFAIPGALPRGAPDASSTQAAGRVDAVRRIRDAYERALRDQKPSAKELEWRLARYDRGRKLVSEIEKRRGPIRNLRVVDLGAAHGGDVCAMAAAGARPVAVDYRDYGYARPGEHLRGEAHRLDAVVANASVPLPFRAAAFDVVVAMSLLEHLADPAAFFREVRRVLKLDGLALISTPVCWKGLRADPFFGSAGTAVLPMPLRRFAATRLFRRSYPFSLQGKTCYSSGAIVRSARRGGLSAEAQKFGDSRVAQRVRRAPLGSLGLRLLNRYALVLIVLRARGAGQHRSGERG